MVEVIESTSSCLRASVAISCASCSPAAAVVRPTCISATGFGASSRKVVCPLSTALRMPWVKWTLWRSPFFQYSTSWTGSPPGRM